MVGIPRYLPPAAAFTLGAALFAALAAGTSAVGRVTALEDPAARQIILKTAMLVVAVALMLLAARPHRVWGLTAPRLWLRSTLLPMVAGGGLGAVCSAVILGLGFAPMAGMRELGLLRIIVIVWFGSTLAEEVFVRGLIQGWMQRDDAGEDGPMLSGSTSRILTSGLLFGMFHLSLFFTGDDPRTAVTIVISTTILGLVCAWSRERSGSLVGPLLAHFAFNACGLLGGIAMAIVMKVLGPSA